MATEQYSWGYRCSICTTLLHPDEVQAHMRWEKAQHDWPGVMRLTRVDLDAEGRPINGED